jgi:hypothetical protein
LHVPYALSNTTSEMSEFFFDAHNVAAG